MFPGVPAPHTRSKLPGILPQTPGPLFKRGETSSRHRPLSGRRYRDTGRQAGLEPAPRVTRDLGGALGVEGPDRNARRHLALVRCCA